MFIRKKRNASGSVSVQIIEKIGRNNKIVQTIGSSKDIDEIEVLYQEGLKLIPQLTKQPLLDLFPNDNSENIIDILHFDSRSGWRCCVAYITDIVKIRP